jgi:hypothetical protein
MATKKKKKKSSTRKKAKAKKAVKPAKRTARPLRKTAKKKAPKKLAKKPKTAAKSNAAGRKKSTARKKSASRGSQSSGIYLPPIESQSGDFQGLSRTEAADSESVTELVDEGNAFEADAVAGVESADDADEQEVHTHEVPEDDVHEEYLDRDE